MAKKKSKKKIFIILSIVIIAIIAIGFAVSSSFKNVPTPVQFSKVERRTITHTVNAVGKIKPELEVKISSEASGEIIFLGVRDGDTVKKGQLLVRIKPDIVETQLEQYKAGVDAALTEIESAKTMLEKAKVDFNRVNELFKKNYASKDEFEKAKSAVDQYTAAYQGSLARKQQAQASYKQMQNSATRTTITSPISGVVTSLSVENGEKVVGTAQMAGTEIMRIADLNTMNSVVDVDENDIINCKIGDLAKIKIDAMSDKELNGYIIEMGHSAKVSASGTQEQVTNFEVKIRLTDKEPKLRPGMSCNSAIATETKTNVLSVPLQSVTVRSEDNTLKSDVKETQRVEDQKEEKFKENKIPPTIVFINENMIAKQVKVETGISDKGFIEIKSGLNEGQEIISGNFQAVSKLLKDGAKVSLEKTKEEKK